MPRPVTNPAWYHSKACFYVFNFTIDFLVVVVFFVGRVDRRFWVPNGSSSVRHYGGEQGEKMQMAREGSLIMVQEERGLESPGSSVSRELTEEMKISWEMVSVGVKNAFLGPGVALIFTFTYTDRLGLDRTYS
jgi:hypothetical protein